MKRTKIKITFTDGSYDEVYVIHWGCSGSFLLYDLETGQTAGVPMSQIKAFAVEGVNLDEN